VSTPQGSQRAEGSQTPSQPAAARPASQPAFRPASQLASHTAFRPASHTASQAAAAQTAAHVVSGSVGVPTSNSERTGHANAVTQPVRKPTPYAYKREVSNSSYA
jgi:hypothetical protein